MEVEEEEDEEEEEEIADYFIDMTGYRGTLISTANIHSRFFF